MRHCVYHGLIDRNRGVFRFLSESTGRITKLICFKEGGFRNKGPKIPDLLGQGTSKLVFIRGQGSISPERQGDIEPQEADVDVRQCTLGIPTEEEQTCMVEAFGSITIPDNRADLIEQLSLGPVVRSRLEIALSEDV